MKVEHELGEIWEQGGAKLILLIASEELKTGDLLVVALDDFSCRPYNSEDKKNNIAPHSVAFGVEGDYPANGWIAKGSKVVAMMQGSLTISVSKIEMISPVYFNPNRDFRSLQKHELSDPNPSQN